MVLGLGLGWACLPRRRKRRRTRRTKTVVTTTMVPAAAAKLLLGGGHGPSSSLTPYLPQPRALLVCPRLSTMGRARAGCICFRHRCGLHLSGAVLRLVRLVVLLTLLPLLLLLLLQLLLLLVLVELVGQLAVGVLDWACSLSHLLSVFPALAGPLSHRPSTQPPPRAELALVPTSPRLGPKVGQGQGQG